MNNIEQPTNSGMNAIPVIVIMTGVMILSGQCMLLVILMLMDPTIPISITEIMNTLPVDSTVLIIIKQDQRI
jgi:hypothetical protein